MDFAQGQVCDQSCSINSVSMLLYTNRTWQGKPEFAFCVRELFTNRCSRVLREQHCCSRNPLVCELIREQFSNKPSLLCFGIFSKLARTLGDVLIKIWYFSENFAKGSLNSYNILGELSRTISRIIPNENFRARRVARYRGKCPCPPLYRPRNRSRNQNCEIAKSRNREIAESSQNREIADSRNRDMEWEIKFGNVRKSRLGIGNRIANMPRQIRSSSSSSGRIFFSWRFGVMRSRV